MAGFTPSFSENDLPAVASAGVVASFFVADVNEIFAFVAAFFATAADASAAHERATAAHAMALAAVLSACRNFGRSRLGEAGAGRQDPGR